MPACFFLPRDPGQDPSLPWPQLPHVYGGERTRGFLRYQQVFTHSNDDPSQLHPPHGGCGRRDRSDPGDLMMEAPSVVTGARAGLSFGLTEQIEFVFENVNDRIEFKNSKLVVETNGWHRWKGKGREEVAGGSSLKR